MHGFRGQQYGEIGYEFMLGPYRPQIKLPAARDHAVEHGVQRELILAGPPRHESADAGAMPPQKRRRGFRAAMFWVGRKDPMQIAIVGLGRVERVERLLLAVMFAECL